MFEKFLAHCPGYPVLSSGAITARCRSGIVRLGAGRGGAGGLGIAAGCVWWRRRAVFEVKTFEPGRIRVLCMVSAGHRAVKEVGIPDHRLLVTPSRLLDARRS